MQEAIFDLLGLLLVLLLPVLLIYWVFLVVKGYDFSLTPKRGWFLMIMFGLVTAAGLLFVTWINNFDCYMQCSSDHESLTTKMTLIALGIVAAYASLTVPTFKRLRRPGRNS